MKITELHIEKGKMNPGMDILVAVDENGGKWVVGGDSNYCTRITEYDSCWETKTEEEWKQLGKFFIS